MEVTPVKREKLYNLILADLSNGNFTAKEISTHLFKRGYLPDRTRQNTAPRLTELCKQGKVEVVGTTIDTASHKRVSIYGKVEK